MTVNIYQITPYFLGGLCSLYRAAFCSILRNETNGTWIDSASHFASVEGVQGLIVEFIFVFVHTNGKSQRPILASIV